MQQKVSSFTSTAIMLLILAAVMPIARSHASPKAAKYAPAIAPADFVKGVDHPYFPLVPGTVYRFVEKEGRDTRDVEVTVLPETKVIMGVTCVVVHDRVSLGGKVLEDTQDWYAQDRRGNVWYFGEATTEFAPDGKADTHGSWEAGVGGAQAGIIMPAEIVPGKPYRQEYLAGEAEDMAQLVAVDQSVAVPFGSYSGCVQMKEWSMLEAGTAKKWYAKGIGFVRGLSSSKELAELVSVTRP